MFLWLLARVRVPPPRDWFISRRLFSEDRAFSSQMSKVDRGHWVEVIQPSEDCLSITAICCKFDWSDANILLERLKQVNRLIVADVDAFTPVASHHNTASPVGHSQKAADYDSLLIYLSPSLFYNWAQYSIDLPGSLRTNKLPVIFQRYPFLHFFHKKMLSELRH